MLIPSDSINPLTPNRRTVRHYKKSLGCRTDVPYVVTKFFFKISKYKYLSATCIKNFKSPALREAVTARRLDFGQISEFFFFFFFFFFFPTVMHRFFKKLRRYFPIPLGIQESFREIAARCKRVNIEFCHHLPTVDILIA